MRKITRRRFLARSAAAVAAPYFIPGHALGLNGAVAPNSRIALGQIGVGNQGQGLLMGALNFSDAQVVALCDLHEAIRLSQKEVVEDKYARDKGRASFKGVDVYQDFRDLLARDDIDAVIIATPDHWHSYMSVMACKAGKDVYCEKPLSQTIRGGCEMVKAVRRYGRVLSCGSQRIMSDMARCVRGGGIGEVKSIEIAFWGTARDFYLPELPVPPGFDYDMWLGPTPFQPYHPNRVAGDYFGNFGWRRCRDYAGGGMTDWGAHYLAGVMFAAGLEYMGPAEVHPPGKEHRHLTYKFPNGVTIQLGPAGYDEWVIHGTEGTAVRSKGNFPPQKTPVKIEYKGRGGIFGDFLHCVRTRELPFQNVEVAHRAATACHLGNIALWLGRSLKWDPEKEAVIGDEEAGRWFDRTARAPWRY